MCRIMRDKLCLAHGNASNCREICKFSTKKIPGESTEKIPFFKWFLTNSRFLKLHNYTGYILIFRSRMPADRTQRLALWGSDFAMLFCLCAHKCKALCLLHWKRRNILLSYVHSYIRIRTLFLVNTKFLTRAPEKLTSVQISNCAGNTICCALMR